MSQDPDEDELCSIILSNMRLRGAELATQERLKARKAKQERDAAERAAKESVERVTEEATARAAEKAAIKEGIERATVREAGRETERVAAVQKIQALQRGKVGRRKAQERKQTREDLYAKGTAKKMTEAGHGGYMRVVHLVAVEEGVPVLGN